MGFAFLPIRKRSRHAWSEPLPVMVCQVSITETIAATRGQLARCIPLLCAFAAVIGLEYNRQLSEQTMFERKLEAGLKEIQPALGKPTHFVVKMKGMKRGVWYSGVAVTIPSLFAQTAYNSNTVWLDPVYEGEQASKPVTFGSDQQGIYSPASDGWIPYEDVVLLEFDGQRVSRLTNIDRETFSGYGALYAREKPFATGF